MQDMHFTDENELKRCKGRYIFVFLLIFFSSNLVLFFFILLWNSILKMWIILLPQWMRIYVTQKQERFWFVFKWFILFNVFILLFQCLPVYFGLERQSFLKRHKWFCYFAETFLFRRGCFFTYQKQQWFSFLAWWFFSVWTDEINVILSFQYIAAYIRQWFYCFFPNQWDSSIVFWCLSIYYLYIFSFFKFPHGLERHERQLLLLSNLQFTREWNFSVAKNKSDFDSPPDDLMLLFKYLPVLFLPLIF